MKKLLFLLFLAIAAIGVKAQDTIFYDAKGKKLHTSYLAFYKSVIGKDPMDSSLYVRKLFWMSGMINKEIRYKNDKGKLVLHGKFYEWYKNGVLKSEVTYVDGQKDGEGRTYDESNKLLERSIYSKGKYVKGLDANGEELIFVAVEKMPEYKGGEKALAQFITDNLHYPSDNLNSDIQGRVYVRFAVGSDGKTSKATVIRSLGSGFDEEAIRVVLSMPSWIPGAQGGIPVPVWYTLPIKFSIRK